MAREPGAKLGSRLQHRVDEGFVEQRLVGGASLGPTQQLDQGQGGDGAAPHDVHHLTERILVVHLDVEALRELDAGSQLTDEPCDVREAARDELADASDEQDLTRRRSVRGAGGDREGVPAPVVGRVG